MLTIRNNIITLTRGDTLRTKVSILNADGSSYVPLANDVITFGLKKTINDTECILEKNIPLDTLELHIAPNETKDLSYGTYVYDVQIQMENGDVYTFIPVTNFIITGEVV